METINHKNIDFTLLKANGKMFANCGFSSTSLKLSTKAIRKYESVGTAQQTAFSQT